MSACLFMPGAMRHAAVLRTIASFALVSVLFACASQPRASSASDAAPTTASASSSPDPVSAGASKSNGQVALLYVNGMGCPLCANNVEKQLRELPGVERVTINLGTGLVTANLSPTNPPSQHDLEKAIADSGFTLVRFERGAGATP